MHMQESTEKPSLIDTAGIMALPVALLWTLSFLSTMYGTRYEMLSILSSILPMLSIWTLFRQLSNYRRLYHPVSWMHILRISLMASLLAGLLTDAAQYAYFAFLDQGQLLSNLATAMQTEEYREAMKQVLPGVSIEEMQQIIQSTTIRDMMVQIVLFNVMIALPFSLMAALPVRKPQPKQ